MEKNVVSRFETEEFRQILDVVPSMVSGWNPESGHFGILLIMRE